MRGKNVSGHFTELAAARLAGPAAVLMLTLIMLTAVFAAETCGAYASSWDTYRGNDENNAVVSFETTVSPEYTASAWTKKFGESASGMGGWNYAPNTPVIHDGKIVTTSYKEIMELDPDTGSVIRRGDIHGAANWGYTAVTCAKLSNGTEVYLCPLGGGTIEAVSADPSKDTLESMWVFRPKEKDADGKYKWSLMPERDKKEGEVPDAEDLTPDGKVYVESAVHQSLCPILYSDGIVYTGYFAGDYEFYDYYVAIAAEKVTVGGKTYEPGDLIWQYKSKGGFYWNGAIAIGNAVIVGTQDGVNNNDVTGAMSTVKADSHILALNKKTGDVITDIKLDDAGDICSGIVWDKNGTGRIYWSSCCGMIHSAEVSTSTGALNNVKSEYLDFDDAGNSVQSLTVNTPVVYNGKVYIGYKPKKGAYGYFAAYDAGTLENVFRAPLKGYPKGSPLITTAYENAVEGRPETGYLYAYISYYQEPGGLQVIKFLPEPKEVEVGVHIREDDLAVGSEGGVEVREGESEPEEDDRSDAEKAYDVTVSDMFGAVGYEQYCAGSVIADDKGQLYYKNDSNAIFAIKKGNKIELGKAEGLKVTASGAKVTARVSKCAGANGYRVLYRLNNKGGFTAVSSGSNKCTFEVPNSSVVTVRLRPEYVDAAKAVYGDYSDDVTIYAAASTIKGLTAAKKAFTVKFDKHAQADGYEIQYSLKSSMASAKTLKKKGYSTVKYKVSKLKAKKKYYVCVRSYRSVDGKKYYGKWSAKKAVKTK